MLCSRQVCNITPFKLQKNQNRESSDSTRKTPPGRNIIRKRFTAILYIYSSREHFVQFKYNYFLSKENGNKMDQNCQFAHEKIQ